MEIVELFNYYFKDINLPLIYGISAIIDLEKKKYFYDMCKRKIISDDF